MLKQCNISASRQYVLFLMFQALVAFIFGNYADRKQDQRDRGEDVRPNVTMPGLKPMMAMLSTKPLHMSCVPPASTPHPGSMYFDNQPQIHAYKHHVHTRTSTISTFLKNNLEKENTQKCKSSIFKSFHSGNRCQNQIPETWTG